MRIIMAALVLCAALAFETRGAFAQTGAPAAGQTIEAWQEAVTRKLETQGDKMGYGLGKCVLKPAPFSDAHEIYLGRGFSKTDETTIALVAVRDGKVTAWKEYVLPGFEGWITHYVRRCRDTSFEALTNARVSQRYRWTGSGFVKAAIGRK